MSAHRIALNQVHRFVMFKRGYLKLQPRRPSGESFAGMRYEIEVLGTKQEGTIEESGTILKAVPRRARKALLRLWDDDEPELKEPHEFEVILATKFPPLEEVSGVQRRLVNLGFDVGDEDGEVGPKTRAAVRAFEEWVGLRSANEEFFETGEITRESEISDDVRKKLKEICDARPGLLHGGEFEGDDEEENDPEKKD